MGLDIAIVAVYVLLLVVMSLRGGRGMKSAADFAASGGRYGTAVIFATMAASYVGGGYSSGNAAGAFEHGISTTLALFGFSLSMVVIGKWIAPGADRFRGEATVGGIIGRCYGRPARILTGIFSFLCCAGVVGAQVETMGIVFQVLLGIPPTFGSLLGCCVVLIYSTFGGMQSVIVADILQFALLAVGMPVLLAAGLYRAGGLEEVLACLPPEYLNPFNGTTPAGFVSLFCCMMLGEALVPPYTQRLLIGKNSRSTARGTVLSGLFSIPFFVITGLIGLTAYVLEASSQAATAMPELIRAVLPTGVRGVVMAAMVSIMLSAADSFLNSASISLVCDTLMPLRPGMTGRQQLRALRLTNLLTGIAAVAVSYAVPDVFGILILAYSFWSPLVLVPLAAGFLGVRSNGRAFRYALLTGLVLTVAWNFVLGKPFGIDGSVIGVLGNLAVFTACTRAVGRYRSPVLTIKTR